MTVKEEIDSMLVSLSDAPSESKIEPVLEPEIKVEEKPDDVRATGSNTPEPEGIFDEVKGKDKDSDKEVPKDGGDALLVLPGSDIEPKIEPKPDERDQTIADLRAKLAEKEVPREPEKKEPPKPPEEQDFLGEVDLDELTRDPKEFNKVLNKIYQRAVVDTRSSVVETLPDIVKANIQIMNELKTTSERFYEENKDLQPFKKVVGVVFDELASANPTKNYNDLIKEVAPEVRKRLDLKKEVKEEKKEKVEPPRLPQKGGRTGKSDKPTLEPLQAELEEMSKILGR